MKKSVFLLLMICLLLPLSVQASLPLPDHLTQIRESAFEGNFSLSGLMTLPENIESVGDRAFASSNIYALRIPAGCRQVGANVLEGTPAAYIYQESGETAAHGRRSPESRTAQTRGFSRSSRLV